MSFYFWCHNFVNFFKPFFTFKKIFSGKSFEKRLCGFTFNFCLLSLLDFVSFNSGIFVLSAKMFKTVALRWALFCMLHLWYSPSISG